MKPFSIQNIMTRDVVSASPDMPLVEVAKILADRGFDGLPVVDAAGKLVGIVTEYDLISKSSVVHLPTFQTILQNIHVLRTDRAQFQKEIEEVASLTVQDVMNDDPLTLPDTATYEDAVCAFRDHHRVNPIPVVNADNHVMGVISRFDVLKPLLLSTGTMDSK